MAADNKKTQIELIEYYTGQFTKVLNDHGAESDYTSYAFYQLQGAKMGMSINDICCFARAEIERLKELCLDLV